MTNIPSVLDIVHVSGGSITRLSETQFVGVSSANGKSYTSRKTAKHATCAFRQMENTLRRVAGLELLPNICPSCGVKERRSGSLYCSEVCVSVAISGKLGKKSQARSDAEVLARAQKEALKRPLQPDCVYGASQSGKKDDAATQQARNVRAALAKADARIRALGGRVPDGYSCDDWQEKRAAMVNRRGEGG